MHIVHIITRMIVGGAQENTLLSCEGQHDRGHRVTLVTGPALGPEGSLLQRATWYGYEVCVLDAMRRSILPIEDLNTYEWIQKKLKALRPDIVHTHSSKAGIIGRWAARSAGVRAIVHTIHGLAFTASTSRLVNQVYRLAEARTAPISTRIVCVADSMRDQSLAANVGRSGQYVTVYSGMKTAPFVASAVSRIEVRRRWGFDESHIVLGTIARLFDLKGHDDLIDIAPRLCAAHPNARFFWIGDGSLRAAFERRIAEIGLADRFVLTGLVPPDCIPELVGAMDILVHPSRREGLARALPQGALAGKPTITYDIDGAREAVLDGKTGVVLKPFDKLALLAAIMRLADDKTSRDAMGRAGQAFAMGRFDDQVMIEGLERVYVDAIRAAGHRAVDRHRDPARVGSGTAQRTDGHTRRFPKSAP